MAKTTLVGSRSATSDIDEGRRFLELLSEAKIKVQAALWQWSESSGEWQFLIVTPLVEKLGLKEAYRRLDDILSTTENRPAIDLLNVYLDDSWGSLLQESSSGASECSRSPGEQATRRRSLPR